VQAHQADGQQHEQPEQLVVALQHDRQRQGAEDQGCDDPDAGRIQRRDQHTRA
jgi:hypothetical protein